MKPFTAIQLIVYEYASDDYGSLGYELYAESVMAREIPGWFSSSYCYELYEASAMYRWRFRGEM